jgi:hypothetical protein
VAVIEEHDDIRVEIAEQSEIDAATQRHLDDLGITLAELQQQADADEFMSERARRLWFFVEPLEGQ